MMRLEWGDVATAEAAYLHEENIRNFAVVDDYHPNQAWLVITVENGGVALSGTRDELVRLLARALDQVLKYT